jgi:CBS domain-containing protein
VRTIDPGADIKEAARLLIEHKIGCLPVVENGKLVGLVTETDLLRVVAG